MKSARKPAFLRAAAFLFATLLAMAAASAPAFAADGGSPDPADSTVGLVFRWLNFLLVFGGLAYVLARYGGTFFRGRAKTITASIQEATTEKAAAEQELRVVSEKVASLDREIAQMRSAASQESAAEAERVAESGRKEIARIEQSYRAEIRAAERAARLELKSLAAGMAVDRAGAIVRARMDPNRRAALFQKFLTQLSGRPN